MEVLPDKIIRLRQLLAGRASSLDGDPSCQPTACPLFGEIGLPHHALSEFVPFSRNESSVTLALYGLLHSQLGRGEHAVLIDGKDVFSPNGLEVIFQCALARNYISEKLGFSAEKSHAEVCFFKSSLLRS